MTLFTHNLPSNPQGAYGLNGWAAIVTARQCGCAKDDLRIPKKIIEIRLQSCSLMPFQGLILKRFYRGMQRA